MGLKYVIGAAADTLLQSILSSRAFPLMRYFPRGRSWLYDAQRFAGSRDLKVAFDVGANIGQTVHDMLRYLPRLQIYCFEPISSTFDALVARYGTRANVSCIRQALGSERGKATVQLRRDSGYNSLLVTDAGTAYLTGSQEDVEINTVDLFCAEQQIERIDLLKMDVQGYELEVIKGAKRMLSSNSVRFVFAEVGFRPNNLEIQMFGDFNSAMSDCGFLFSGFYDLLRYGDNKEFTLFANALYMHPKFGMPQS
jgi:FkbM family methyltransferase